jgi:hypothetical protein
MPNIENWVIWSEEHGGWWMAGAMGYTPSLFNAGRFTEGRARLIEDTANRYLPGGIINEVAMPDPWLRAADRPRQALPPGSAIDGVSPLPAKLLGDAGGKPA